MACCEGNTLPRRSGCIASPKVCYYIDRPLTNTSGGVHLATEKNEVDMRPEQREAFIIPRFCHRCIRPLGRPGPPMQPIRHLYKVNWELVRHCEGLREHTV